MEVKLVVVGGDVKATEIALKLPAIIGRGREAAITLGHPLVSRQHCRLFEQAGKLMVKDLGSLNGTFVDNERITETELPAGHLLTVGTATFRAVYGAAAAAAPAKPPAKRGRTDTEVPEQEGTVFVPNAAGRSKPAAPATELVEEILDFESLDDSALAAPPEVEPEPLADPANDAGALPAADPAMPMFLDIRVPKGAAPTSPPAPVAEPVADEFPEPEIEAGVEEILDFSDLDDVAPAGAAPAVPAPFANTLPPQAAPIAPQSPKAPNANELAADFVEELGDFEEVDELEVVEMLSEAETPEVPPAPVMKPAAPVAIAAPTAKPTPVAAKKPSPPAPAKPAAAPANAAAPVIGPPPEIANPAGGAESPAAAPDDDLAAFFKSLQG